MGGDQKFSKIDLSKAYLQMEVHLSDRYLLTLNTHKVIYQPTRLMFGVASAPTEEPIKCYMGGLPSRLLNI